MYDMYQDCERVLVSKEEIQAMVERLGRQISEDYEGEPLALSLIHI